MGYSPRGYNRMGYNPRGYSPMGYRPMGYSRKGYSRMGSSRATVTASKESTAPGVLALHARGVGHGGVSMMGEPPPLA